MRKESSKEREEKTKKKAAERRKLKYTAMVCEKVLNLSRKIWMMKEIKKKIRELTEN